METTHKNALKPFSPVEEQLTLIKRGAFELINESGIVENNLELIDQESQKIASGLRDLKMRKINNNKAINQIG